MKVDQATILSHLYGIASLVLGLLGVFYLVESNASWREYALVASGWLAAILFAFVLMKCITQTRIDGMQIAAYEQQVKALEKEIDGHKALLLYFASLQTGRVATPRIHPAADASAPHP